MERAITGFVSRDDFIAQIENKAPNQSVQDVHKRIEELHMKISQNNEREISNAQEARADYLEKFRDLKQMITDLDTKLGNLENSEYDDELPSPRKLGQSKTKASKFDSTPNMKVGGGPANLSAS
jgi:hypothetical protein